MSKSIYARCLLLALVVCMSGCAMPQGADAAQAEARLRETNKIEVYYRGFLTTSLFRLDQQTLKKAVNVVEIKDPAQIERVKRVLDVSCHPSGTAPADMDLRLMVRFMRHGEVVRTWTASKFEYHDSNTTVSCALPADLQNEIVDTLMVRGR